MVLTSLKASLNTDTKEPLHTDIETVKTHLDKIKDGMEVYVLLGVLKFLCLIYLCCLYMYYVRMDMSFETLQASSSSLQKVD